MKKEIKKNKLIYFLTILLAFLSNLAYSQTLADYNIITQRIYNEYAKYPGNVDYILDSIVNDGLIDFIGSFNNLDYTQDWHYAHHTNLTLLLAQAYIYSKEQVTNQREDEIKEAYLKSLTFFLKENDNHNYEQNDWYRDAGCPISVSKAHFLMYEHTPQTLNSLTDNYLENAFNNRINRYGHAADVVQQIDYLIPFYIIKQDSTKLDTLVDDLSTQLKPAKPWENFYTSYRNSGIEADFSFTAHNEYGRQIYNGGYGEVFIENVSRLFSLLHGTSLQLNSTSYNNFSDYLSYGYQWTFYNKNSDNSVIGRENTNESKQPPLATTTFQPYLSLNPPKSLELNNILERIENGINDSNYLKGNKYFWRSDMMVHRNKNYYFSIRMTSDRTVAPETDDNSTKNYYAGAGVTHLMKNGDEYTNNYHTLFDPLKFPGTTVEQESITIYDPDIDSGDITDSGKIKLLNWGAGGKNKDSFAGGVTDGSIGACGMIWDKRGVKAYKSWFMFENEIVALGTGITQTNGTAPVMTTLNQSRKFNNIYYKRLLGNQQELNGSLTLENTNKLEWLFHDGVGYFPISENDSFEISESSNANVDLFSIGINHGVNPENKKYAYIIKPDISISEANNNQSQNIEIIENTKNTQAVYNSESDVFQAIFYKAGEITISAWENTVIKVNEASLVMIKRNINDESYTFVVSNPLGENSPTRYKEITFKKDYTRLRLKGDDREDDISVVSVDQHESILSFDAWNSRWGGQSSREKKFVRECSVAAASSNDGNLPYNTRDNSLFSRWSALGLGEYIQYRLCGEQEDINYVDIAFYRGNKRFAYFNISISKDENAQIWEDVLVNKVLYKLTNEKQRFFFNSIKQDVKYVRYTGYGNNEPSRNLWNSLTEFDWGNTDSNKNELIYNSLEKKAIENINSISPNPVINSANITSTEIISKLTLYSIDGRNIISLDNLNTKQIKLDFSKYAKGIYLVKIFYENGEYLSKKIIKE